MNKLLHQSKRFFRQNGSTILTCVGAIGVVATAVMTAKAAPKASHMLEMAEEEKGEELTKLESIKVAGPIYIPSVAFGVATITCIFGANMLNKRQQASLISAYALLDSSYKDYKKKVEELYGEESSARVREEIAKDKYDDTDIEFDDDKQLFYDEFSGRMFRSTLANVIQAEYNVNKKIREYGGAYLNEFYEPLEIDTDYGYELGWSTGRLQDSWKEWLNFEHETHVMDDGLECTFIKIEIEPVIDFQYY